MEVGIAVAFWALASITVGSSLMVLALRDIFRSALFLVVSFLGVAGLYLTLRADFLAVVQILIYAGAVSMLLIFAIMLTRDVSKGNPSNNLTRPAIFLGAILLVILVLVIVNTDWGLSDKTPPEVSTGVIADVLFSRYILPFEVAGVLLLAAILGAIVLVRDDT